MADVCASSLGPLASLLEKGTVAFRIERTRSGALWFLPERADDVPRAWQVFAPRGFFLHLGWMAWQVGLPVSERVWLNSALLEALAQTAVDGFEPTGLLLYVGTPGAYRKATLGYWGGKLARAVVKLGLTPAANDAVQWEARVLAQLGQFTDLADTVPGLLRTGSWQGWSFHVTAPVVGGPGPAHLTPAHFAFCERLFSIERRTERWEKSHLLREWLHDRDTLERSDQPSPLIRATGWITERLAGRKLSFGWAHRDFAPWNIRRLGQQLIILDWEAARPFRPPGYDLLHFVTIRRALRNGHGQVPWDAFRAWLFRLAPEWARLERELYVAYLVDQAFLYKKARILVPEMGDDRVLRWLLKEIDRVMEGVS